MDKRLYKGRQRGIPECLRLRYRGLNPDDDYTAKITPQAFEIWYRAVKFISANADQSSFTKLKVNTYLECGKVRLIPKVTNGTEIGTDLVFLD